MSRRALAGMAPPPPAGGLEIGFNFRETEGYIPSDGNIDVFTGVQAPTLRTNLNGVSLVAGWAQNGREPLASALRDEGPADGDPRLAGWCQVLNRAYFDMELPIGDYRVWIGCGRTAAAGSIDAELYDGLYVSLVNPEPAVKLTDASGAADEFFTINSAVRPRLDWTAQYGTDFFDFSVPDRGARTGASLMFFTGFFTHIRVQQQ